MLEGLLLRIIFEIKLKQAGKILLRRPVLTIGQNCNNLPIVTAQDRPFDQIRYNQGTFKGKINPAAAYAMLLDLRLRFKPVYFFRHYLPKIKKRMAEIPLRINAVCTCQIIYSQTIDILG